MTSAAQIAEKSAIYLERFTREGYEPAFARLQAECAPLFASFEEDERRISDAVDELIGLARERSASFLRRSRELDRLRRFFAIYLAPAAGESGSEAADRFIRQLQSRWNAEYPKVLFSIGSYKDIAGGFRTKPFGMR